MDRILGYARLCTQVLDSPSSACPVALGHRGCVPAGDPQSTSLNFPGHVLLSYYCFLLLLSSHHPQGIKNIYKNIAVGRRGYVGMAALTFKSRYANHIPNSSTQARGNTSGLLVMCIFWKMRGLITRLSGCSWSGQAFTSWSRRPSDRICPISSASCTHGRTWPRLTWGRRSSHLACTGKILYSSSHFYFFPFLFGTLNSIMICITLISLVFRKYLKVLPNNSMDLC